MFLVHLKNHITQQQKNVTIGLYEHGIIKKFWDHKQFNFNKIFFYNLGPCDLHIYISLNLENKTNIFIRLCLKSVLSIEISYYGPV